MENMLRFYRRKLDIKQNDMADAINISPSYLCKIEKGQLDPSDDIRKRCASYLDISVGRLFPREVNQNRVDRVVNKLSNRVWSLRQEKGIKQYQLAKKIGCSPSYLSRVEKGIISPNNEFRKKCARALKVPETELFPR